METEWIDGPGGQVIVRKKPTAEAPAKNDKNTVLYSEARMAVAGRALLVLSESGETIVYPMANIIEAAAI